jgi:hypothetical protein
VADDVNYTFSVQRLVYFVIPGGLDRVIDGASDHIFTRQHTNRDLHIFNSLYLKNGLPDQTGNTF